MYRCDGAIEIKGDGRERVHIRRTVGTFFYIVLLLTLGSPVVPEVYMIVQRSLAAGGMGSAGLDFPRSMNSS